MELKELMNGSQLVELASWRPRAGACLLLAFPVRIFHEKRVVLLE